MNILNILYTFNPGGVERLAIDISNQLVKMNNNVHLCVISESYKEELLKQVNTDVIQHRLKKLNKNRKLGYLKQLLNIIDRNKIQVIHVHQGSLMSFYLILKVLRPSVRFYFTVHDTYIFSELSSKDRWLSRFICKKLIAISNAVVDNIEKNGVSKRKIVRVYNGVNFEHFPFIERKNISNREVQIVNVARFFPAKKGQDILIKAISILKNKGYSIHLSFAGGEVTESLNSISEMKELSKNLDVYENIDFLGNVSDVPSVLTSADIFCIPSRYEGFGISAVEALGTGLPCVASDIVGLNEVVNSRDLGELFEVGNERDLADKIEYVIKNYYDYNLRQISQNVRSRFSIESMARQLLNIYER